MITHTVKNKHLAEFKYPAADYKGIKLASSRAAEYLILTPFVIYAHARPPGPLLAGINAWPGSHAFIIHHVVGYFNLFMEI